MQKIIITSKNPVKINATLNGFKRMFPNEDFVIESLSVPSLVRDQPMSGSETRDGAYNRVINAYNSNIVADYYVGIEGGIEEINNEMQAFAWIFIKHKSGLFGKARTSTFFLPPKVAILINQGKELGEADDIVFGKTNSKQENGAVGILTGDIISRTHYYTEAIILALIPFKNPDLY